jgi:redox-sensitive bicupin YhaK (pirin superfamily)
MSTLDRDLDALERPVINNGLELTGARIATVGDMSVRRLLPLRLRRSIGAWCFVDHYGPMSVDGISGMVVPPHPHIGLQTVTWLLAGDVLHRDSLGSEQVIRPGQLNLMTAGEGIAHAEESPVEHDPSLHGVQLWVALPDASRHAEPKFEHHPDLPVIACDGLMITVFLGALAQTRSPATTFSDLVGAQISASRTVRTKVAVNAGFEHAIFVVDGQARVAGTDLRPGNLLYLPAGREEVPVAVPAGTTLLLLGGVPLDEPLLMWWNFVARTPDEITTAVSNWQDGKFGEVGGYDGDPLPAPPLRAELLRTRPVRRLWQPL